MATFQIIAFYMLLPLGPGFVYLAIKQKYVEKAVKAIISTMNGIIDNMNINAKAEALTLKNQERIDNIVDMLRRNARTAAIASKTGKMESPLQPTPTIRPYYDKIRDELVDYYLTIGMFLTDREIFEDIQRRFGPLFEEQICEPLHMMSNECIELAIGYMKHEAGAA